jgi:outer membrane protein OmpA-like peptidoglycan-associated protein
MRSSLFASLAAFAAAAAGCASAQTDRVCTPILSWATPAYQCSGGAPPAAEPEPEPAAEPAPEQPPPEPPPERVVVKEEKIEINEKVQFETGSAVLKKESESLLDEVAKALKDHPDVKRVRVEGHTDSRASDKYNKRLSKKRAEAVREYLIAHGIAGKRLIARGYGEEKPIADNKSDDGRYQNRRVEFTILAREAPSEKPSPEK